jgi:hypothetical protein
LSVFTHGYGLGPAYGLKKKERISFRHGAETRDRISRCLLSGRHPSKKRAVRFGRAWPIRLIPQAGDESWDSPAELDESGRTVEISHVDNVTV